MQGSRQGKGMSWLQDSEGGGGKQIAIEIERLMIVREILNGCEILFVRSIKLISYVAIG